MIMNQVNATEIQEHLSDFLDSLTQGETSIIIEKAQKSDRYYH
jgi:antitoxin (DNA-binding transcriptional repressor) of toxin-antitoxin stability system